MTTEEKIADLERELAEERRKRAEAEQQLEMMTETARSLHVKLAVVERIG